MLRSPSLDFSIFDNTHSDVDIQIFLGTPHRATCLEDLEDQIYDLLLLPGPEIRPRLVQKTEALAVQTESINNDFLETKLFDRAVVSNVFAQRTPTALRGSRARGRSESSSQQTGNWGANTLYDELNSPVIPFTGYSVSPGLSFEAFGRYIVTNGDHLDLVRGQEFDWMGLLSSLFYNTGGGPRKSYLHSISRSLS